MRPQRYAVMARRSSRWTTTRASSVGATLNRGPGSSTSGSAAKISASSEAGRCWVNRPHMPGKSSRRLLYRRVDGRPPEARPAPAALDVDGPLSREDARAILDRGAELLSAGDFGQAFNHYRRVIGFDDPEVTAAALLGAAQSRYRMDDEAGAVATWEAILELPETPTTYYAWRELAAARVRDGDLHGAISAYREADKRAPVADKAEIANRLGWLAKETGNVRASRRYFARGRGGVLPLATYAILGITIAVSLTAILSIDGSLDLRRPCPLQAGGCRWRDLAALDGDACPRRRSGPAVVRALASRIQHVRAVHLRAARRADLRPDPPGPLLSRCRGRRFDRVVRVRGGSPAGSVHRGRSSGSSACCSRHRACICLSSIGAAGRCSARSGCSSSSTSSSAFPSASSTTWPTWAAWPPGPHGRRFRARRVSDARCGDAVHRVAARRRSGRSPSLHRSARVGDVASGSPSGASRLRGAQRSRRMSMTAVTAF